MKTLLLLAVLCRADVVEPGRPRTPSPTPAPTPSKVMALGLSLAAAGVLGAYLARRRA